MAEVLWRVIPRIHPHMAVDHSAETPDWNWQLRWSHWTLQHYAEKLLRSPEHLSHVFMALHPTKPALAQVHCHPDPDQLTQCPSHHDCSTSSDRPAGTVHSSLEMIAEKCSKESKKVLTSFIFIICYTDREKLKFDWFDQTKQFKHLLPNFRPKKIAAMQKQLINQKQKIGN